MKSNELSNIISEDGTYTIPVSWSVWSTITVEADSLADAVRIAREKLQDIPITKENEYIDDSYRIDGDNDEDLIKAQDYRRISPVCIHRDGTITR